MKLSALEIKSQEFKRAIRGLDEAEVQSFLDMVASQWHEVQEDLRRSEERTRELESKIVHYQKIEEALQEALTSAKASSKATVAEAERQAELVIREAEIRARALAREAESRMRTMHDSANAIGRRRKEIVARLGAFLRAEMEMLDDYREGSRDDAIPELPHPQEDPFGGELAAEGESEAHDLIPANPVEAAPSEQMSEEPIEFESDPVGYEATADADVDYGEESVADTVERDESAMPEFAEEREPVERQEHAVADAGFDGKATTPADAGDGEDGDELSHEDTEWRIRRILDNLE